MDFNPIFECMKQLSGKDKLTLITDIVRNELQDIYEQPYHILDYLDRARCAIFLELEKGIEQLVLNINKEKKNHTHEITASIPP